MDDLKVFQDLVKPKVEITEINTDEEGSDISREDTPSNSGGADETGNKGDSNDENNGDNTKQNSDVEKSFQFEEDETKIGIEQLGTLLSAFLQDDSGRNVVDAIVQNSKWQRNICRALEKIGSHLEKQNK